MLHNTRQVFCTRHLQTPGFPVPGNRVQLASLAIVQVLIQKQQHPQQKRIFLMLIINLTDLASTLIDIPLFWLPEGTEVQVIGVQRGLLICLIAREGI